MRRIFKLIKYIIYISIFFSIVGTISTVCLYYYLEPELPSVDPLKDAKFSVPLKIYSRDNKLIAEFGKKRRAPMTFDEIPKDVINAFLAAEDDRFFTHPGVDYQGILRAIFQLVITGKKGSGGSTITMQVARNFLLTNEKTYIRKIKEIFLAIKIEQELDKKTIIELYLNRIFLGNRAYGLGAASQVYYGTTPDNLTIAQIAMIAGLPKSPSTKNPIANPTQAKYRRGYVLRRMLKLGFITQEQFAEANSSPVTAKLHGQAVEINAPYIAEMARTEALTLYGSKTYTEGYKVFTTIEKSFQNSAQNALRKGLLAYDRRHGYKGPEKNFGQINNISDDEKDLILNDFQPVGELLPGLVASYSKEEASIYLGQGKYVSIFLDDSKWARKYLSDFSVGPKVKQFEDFIKEGDLIRLEKQIVESKAVKPQDQNQGGEKSSKIETTSENASTPKTIYKIAQIPEVSGAFVSLSPRDGAILALVGGFDYYYSKFNRVTQAYRQAGSGIKPFIYSAALEKGFTPASLINDAPIVFSDSSLENTWRPENYSKKFYGPTRLRVALRKSRNLVSIRLLHKIGTRYAINYLSKFGFDINKLPNDLSLALGSATVSPLEMATGYSTIANGGYKIEPYFISRIENLNGDILYEASPKVAVSKKPSTKTENSDSLATNSSATNTASSDNLDKNGIRSEKLADSNSQPNNSSLPITTFNQINYADRATSYENIYLLTSMLKDVVKRGTARKALVLSRDDLAGKTGTTNDQKDAWFNGFNGDIVATAWVGFDQVRSLGKRETGGGAALPIWIDFMKTALKDSPETILKRPPEIVSVRIDKKTGKQTKASNPDAIFELFRVKNLPPKDYDTETISGSANGNQASPYNDSSQTEDIY